MPSRTTNNLLLIITVVLFGFGISLPMFTLTKLIFLEDSFSLLAGSYYLLLEGEVFLFCVIFGFSVITPIYKFILCSIYINSKDQSAQHKLKIVKKIIAIGKWSMADVFVIAVLASTVKFGAIANVEIHIGLIIFGCSVISAMLLTQRIATHYELRPRQVEP